MKRFGFALCYRVAATWLMLGASVAAGAAQSKQSAVPPHAKAHAVSLQQLERQITALQREVQTLKAHEDRSWISRQEQSQIKRIVEAVLRDSARHEQALQQQTTAGYDHGFFINSLDHNFRIKIRGYVQAGYSFAYSSVGNAQNISTTGQPIGPPAVGDASRFTLRRARLIFSGHAWSPRVVYEVSGDFAGANSSNGYFKMTTTYGGYRFWRQVLLRAGVLRVPFTYLSDYPVTGDDFGSFPLLFTPFNASRSLGLDLSGKLFSDHLTYDAQVNNGSKAGNSGVSIDNRFGSYIRVQWSHGGRVSRFEHEAAMRWRNHVAWMLGVGAGYESQNSTADAYPSPQTSLTIAGLSTPDGAGFYPSFPANGSLYRATADAHLKFNGMDASATVFFQQYNDRPPAGSSTDDFATALGRRSLYEIAYYGELGYFLIPRKWQIIGRAGELFTQGGDKQMVEFGLGLNRYIYGRNVRVQTALIYIPNAAALSSSSTNVVLNAQNLISQVQVQIRF